MTERVDNPAPSATSVASPAGVILGQSAGNLIQPARRPAKLGPELWALANFHSSVGQRATLTPSIVGNGTAQTVRTLAYLGGPSAFTSYQFEFTINSWPSAAGWSWITAQLVDAAGTIIAGTAKQALAAYGAPFTGKYLWDFEIPVTANPMYLDVSLQVFNNVPSGTFSISGVSLRGAVAPSRPLQYVGSGGHFTDPQVFQQLHNPATGAYSVVQTSLADDGALTTALSDVLQFNVPDSFRYPPADPLVTRASGAVTDQIGSDEILVAATTTRRSARIGNNDQIIEVLKQDGTTYELRGNTHGGETIRGSVTWELDMGDGVWTVWDGVSSVVRTCRRLRLTMPTKMTRSAPDSDDFANVDHVATFFPDGMMRMDRSTTFLKAMTVRNHFEWMSSHDTATPKIGRLGRGLISLDDIDIHTRLAVPAAPTAAANNAAGTLPAATYRYVITALTEGGETTPSAAVTQATTGGTSTVTLTLPAAATGQTGWRVYGRSNALGRMVLLATLPATATTWADDYTAPLLPQEPPRVNTARRLDTTSLAADTVWGDGASWAVWKDLPTGACFGNIFDRDSILARSGVSGIWVRLQSASGIVKNYINPAWTDASSASLADYPYSHIAVPSGTVWTATHYAYAYMPEDANRYELEIATRAADLAALATMYPST